MGKTIFELVVFMSAWIYLQHGFGFAFHIELDPTEVSGFLHDKVTVTCKFDNADSSNITEIFLLQMSKDGQNIAIFHKNTKANIKAGRVPILQVEGNISKVVSESYLRVTLAKPTKKDAGKYTCLAYYLGEAGGVQATSSAELTVTNYDMNSTVKSLYDKVADLEIQLQKQIDESKAKDAKMEQMMQEHSTRLDALEKKHGGQQTTPGKNKPAPSENELKSNMSILEKRLKDYELECGKNTDWIANLTKQLEVQEKQLDLQRQKLQTRKQEALAHLNNFTALKNSTSNNIARLDNEIDAKDKLTEYFSAVHNKSGYFSAGAVFAYGGVIAREGKGYDGNTGIFTAPVAGYYLFHLSITAYANSWIYIDLDSSKGQIFLRLFAGRSKKNEDFSHGGCVAQLEAGEQVKPIIFNADANYASNAAHTIGSGRISRFSGYLLKAL